MRLRRFRDATLRGAMAQVRAELGSEALILDTRRVGGGVEVTAALDETDAALPPRAQLPTRSPRLQAPPRDGASDGEQIRLTQLEWHGVPLALARRLRAGPLAFALSLALRFNALDLTGSEAILLAGPPGAGKTLTTVRLATRLVLAGRRPLVVCADAGRAGAAEQLVAFTRLLGIELVEASDADEVAALLRGRTENTPVLIDTQGIDPWQRSAVDALRALADGVRARTVAVLPAGLDPCEAADFAAGYAELGATALIATRLDVARRLGGILSAAACGLALVELGVGAGAADGLVPATPDLLARRLLAPPPSTSVLSAREQTA